MPTHDTDVCIVGGGPAGMMLGLLLAKQGVKVLIVESHADFAREFRGEVLQPRFMQMLDQVGLRDFVTALPHSNVRRAEIYEHNHKLGEFSFAQIAPQAPYAMWMPQPILLQALHDKAVAFPSCEMWFHTTVRSLKRDGDRVTGCVVDRDGEKVAITAKVTVGADGRFSMVRKLGGFEMEYEHLTNEIIWFAIPRPPDHDGVVRALLTTRHNYLLLPKYPDLIQVGITMAQGEWKGLMAQGLDAIKTELAGASDLFQNFADSLVDFKPFHPLAAKIEYVRKWAQDGCLLIGDAAHCSSPVGAIGVSLAVATAMVAADTIWHGLQADDLSATRLDRVQAVRQDEIRQVHKLQIRAETAVMGSSWFMSHVRPWLVSGMLHSGLASRFASRLLLMKEPLPIDPSFTFTEG